MREAWLPNPALLPRSNNSGTTRKEGRNRRGNLPSIRQFFSRIWLSVPLSPLSRVPPSPSLSSAAKAIKWLSASLSPPQSFTSLPIRGLHWVNVTSYLCCTVAMAVCFAAGGLRGRNVNRNLCPPDLALQCASLVLQSVAVPHPGMGQSIPPRKKRPPI